LALIRRLGAASPATFAARCNRGRPTSVLLKAS
jgi:hypothetical protein